MKYTIIHVDDRAKKNIDHNKKILKNFEYVDDIEYFNGNFGNAKDVLNHMQIPLDRWKPYDGRTLDPLPGEYGIWISTINVLKYIVNNKIDNMLVLEDDVLLQQDFVLKFNEHISELPDNFDFLSLYYFDGHNKISEQTDIGLKNIHLSYNQYSGGQAILYSFRGAKKLLKCIYRKGIEYTSDCFIFRQSLEKMINGYSTKHPNDYFLNHINKNIKSIIDPNNIRRT